MSRPLILWTVDPTHWPGRRCELRPWGRVYFWVEPVEEKRSTSRIAGDPLNQGPGSGNPAENEPSDVARPVQ